MSKFFLEKLTLEILEERVRKDKDLYFELEKYKNAFEIAEKFYERISELEELKDYMGI